MQVCDLTSVTNGVQKSSHVLSVVPVYCCYTTLPFQIGLLGLWEISGVLVTDTAVTTNQDRYLWGSCYTHVYTKATTFPGRRHTGISTTTSALSTKRPLRLVLPPAWMSASDETLSGSFQEGFFTGNLGPLVGTAICLGSDRSDTLDISAARGRKRLEVRPPPSTPQA